jgi:hypothetical protein
MATTAQAGTVGFGPQPAMGTLATDWYRHRATLVDLAVQDPQQEGAPEVGGLPVPTFPYKTGPMVGGGLTLQPRLIDTLGWLLYGVLGDVDSDEDPGGSGIYNHVFKMASGNETYVPWMSFRKHIPRRGADAATDLGEIYKDCKVMGFTLNLPNSEPLTARVDVSGREFEFDYAPDAWTWENTFEHWESIPVACQVGGFLNIDDVEFPVVQASVGFQNVPLDPRQERVYGSPFLEDITVLQRRMVYDMTVKWNNPDLYTEIVTGASDGSEWSSAPKTASFSVKAVSSVNMPDETEQYSLQIDADEVMMSLQGGITLAANQAIMMRFTGVALESDTNFCSATLRNKIASYAWPAS